MNRVLVTGSRGFIGSALTEHLRNCDYEVRGAIRYRPQATSYDTVVVGDMGPTTDWGAALNGVTAVVHLAGRAHILRERNKDAAELYHRTNVQGVGCLARAARDHGVRRFVYLSTIGVHGSCSSAPFSEESPIRPWNDYSRSKWEAEELLRSIGTEGDMDVVILRPPLVYGPNAKGNFDRLVRHIQAGMPIPVAVHGATRSLIGLDNLLDLITRCLEHPKAGNETFVVSDGADITVSELATQLAVTLKRRAWLVPVPIRLIRLLAKVIKREAVVDRLFGSLRIDSTKIQQLLGWTPPFTIEAGLSKAARWYAEHPNRSMTA